MQWGQSPKWNPGYVQTKADWAPLGAALSARVFDFVHRSAAPLGLNKCIDYYYPGLALWSMQEYRPKGLFYDMLKINVSTMYSFQWTRRILLSKYDVLVVVSARTYWSEYLVLILMFPKAIGDRATQITTSIPFLYSRVLSLCCSYIYIRHSKHS